MKTKEELKEMYINNHTKNWDDETKQKYISNIEEEFSVWYDGYSFPKKESIICAAIQIVGTGKIFYGHRHDQCNNSLNGELTWYLNRQQVTALEKIQGFVTSENRFVTREEALKIALDNDQVIDKTQIVGDRLFSENLY